MEHLTSNILKERALRKVVTENLVFVKYKSTVSQKIDSILRNMSNVISSEQFLPYQFQVPLQLWENEMGRLRDWASNTGVRKTGQASLVSRLRNAYDRRRIIQLLTIVEEWIQGIKVIITLDLEYGLASELESSPEDPAEETEMQEVYRGLVETVSCLCEMGC